MADKFSKVNPTSVIIWGEFSGILDLADGGPDPASPMSSILGSGAKWDGAGSLRRFVSGG